VGGGSSPEQEHGRADGGKEGGKEGRREGRKEGGRAYRISSLAPSRRKRTMSPVVPKARKT